MAAISKTQIDRLGDRLRKGAVSDETLRLLDDYRRSFSDAYEAVVGTIRSTTHLEPTGRPAKSTTSIVEKLRRETIRLSQIQDIAGCRVIVQDVLTQDKVVEQLKGLLPKVAVIDRRKEPSYGYRAVHLIVTAHDKLVKIQVRTELQHLWAQLYEKLSDVIDPAIKYGGGNTDALDVLSTASENVRLAEEMEQRARSVELSSELTVLKGAIKQSLEEMIAVWEDFS